MLAAALLAQNKLAAVAVFHTSLAFAVIGFGERALMDHCSEDPAKLEQP